MFVLEMENLNVYQPYIRIMICIIINVMNEGNVLNLEEALFWILDEYIMDYSFDYELHNRVRYVDNRRLAFETIRKLYLCIGEPYYSMNENELCGILKMAPFNDKIHRDLNLIDDFETLAQEIWNYVKISPWISYKVKHNLRYFIDKPYRGKYGGIDNFDEAFIEMCIKFEEIINELEHKKMYGEAKEIFKRMKDTKAIFSADNIGNVQ